MRRSSERDLLRSGLNVERQKPLSFTFEGLQFERALKVDLLVEDVLVLEVKSTEQVLPIGRKQLLTYLRVLGHPVGLLLNFGAPTLKDGLLRVVNRLHPEASPHLRVNRVG